MTDSYLVQLQLPDGEWVDVGLLRTATNTNWFESLDKYWSLPSRPVLGQVFEEQDHSWRPNARVALPHWFSHLLPEGRLRDAVAAAAGIKVVRELPLLALLGEDDLPGAIRVVPSDEDGNALPPDDDENDDESGSDINPLLKFSLAGLQMKFSIHQSDRGLTIPVSGSAGNMILKLPDARPGYDDVPEAEFAAMKLAAAAGIPTPEVSLVDAKKVDGLSEWAKDLPGASFAIVRFDRTASGNRIHAEEIAQVLNISPRKPYSKYRNANFETVANVVANLVGVEAVGDVIDRIVLNVLVGNGDAHLKNWAFTYPDGRRPALSPVFDVLPTVLYVKNDDLGMNLNGSKEFELITASSFEGLGDASGYGAAAARKRAEAAAERILAEWRLMDDILSREKAALLGERLRTLALAK